MQNHQKQQLSTPSTKSGFIQEEIYSLKDQLEAKGSQLLNLTKPTPLEVVLTCRHKDKYECGFKYLFRKRNEDPEESQYQLITEFESHHLKCLEELSPQIKYRPDILSSPSFKLYKPELNFDIQPFSPKMQQILSLRDCDDEKDCKLQKQLSGESLLLRSKHASKLYTEDEVSMLKKQLQFQSKGLISKSTQFHPELGYITNIQFKCKYENINCPYLSTLSYVYEINPKHKKLYKLQKIHNQHLPSCILDDQQINYNAITRKIDQNLSMLVKIIQEDRQIKPKKVLEQFAKEMEENNIDFIYKGINTKINRRAVKKYFDNSVAKARNMLK